MTGYLTQEQAGKVTSFLYSLNKEIDLRPSEVREMINEYMKLNVQNETNLKDKEDGK